MDKKELLMKIKNTLKFEQQNEKKLDYNKLIELIVSGSNVYFTSDWHFSHKNIVKFETEVRQHLVKEHNLSYEALNKNSLEKDVVKTMDKSLIQEWNRTVSKDDIVFYLGDFSFSHNEIEEVLKNLNGHIVFIHGNHDKSITKGLFDKYLFARQQYLEIKLPVILNSKVESLDLVLFHYPILEWNRMHHNAIHLYGHVHSTDLSSHWIGAASKRAINACYDFNNGKMLSLIDIYNITNKLDKIKRH